MNPQQTLDQVMRYLWYGGAGIAVVVGAFLYAKARIQQRLK